MTEMALSRPRGAVTGAVAGIGRAIWETYRRGGGMVIAAPALLAIAIVPEFVQHVAEIHLGMFDGIAAFRGHADDPLRWAFGYAKLAGFLLAILTTARFWAVGSVKRALLVPPVTLVRVVVAVVVGFALAYPFEWIGRQGLPVAVNVPLQIASIVIQSGVMLYLIGALLEDPTIAPRRAFTTLLPAALVLALLTVLTFAPAQALHMANHKLALGQPAAIVWALMMFDALWVGLFAALVGSALYVGYSTGLTWRGWSEHPAALDHRRVLSNQPAKDNG